MISIIFLMIGCTNKKNKGDLSEFLNKIEDNYELDIEIYFYDLLESKVNIKKDGNKSHFIEGDFTEFYYFYKTNSDLIIYEKQGNNYFEKTQKHNNENKKFFSLINPEWFTENNGNYIINDESIKELRELMNIEPEIVLKTADIIINKNSISDFNLEFEGNRDRFFVNIKILNVGKTTVLLPEVQ